MKIFLILLLPAILLADIHADRWDIKVLKHKDKTYTFETKGGKVVSVNGKGYGQSEFVRATKAVPVSVDEAAAIDLTVKQIEEGKIKAKSKAGQVVVPNFGGMNKKQKREWVRKRYREDKYKFESASERLGQGSEKKVTQK